MSAANASPAGRPVCGRRLEPMPNTPSFEDRLDEAPTSACATGQELPAEQKAQRGTPSDARRDSSSIDDRLRAPMVVEMFRYGMSCNV